MDISEYYNKAKLIVVRSEASLPELTAALDYDDDLEHPKYWVPNVQRALLLSFKREPNKEFSEDLLTLYIQGCIMEDIVVRKLTIKASIAGFTLGVFVGWLMWV